MNKLYDSCVVEASGIFLCERLPDDWMDLEEEALYNICEEDAWEPFELLLWSGERIFKEIDCVAKSLKKFVEFQNSAGN